MRRGPGNWDQETGETGMTDAGDTAQVRSLMTAANPVAEDAFAVSWTDELWQEEYRKILASGGQPGAGRSPGQRKRPGRRWQLAALTAAAAGTAAALFIASGPQTPPVPHLSHLSVFSPAAGSIGGGSGSGEPARLALLAVARKAAHAPVVPGRYWLISSEYGNFRPVGPSDDRYMILERGRTTWWQPRKPGDSSEEWLQRLGAKLGSAADVAPWHRDGSPGTWNTGTAEGVADPQGFSDGGPVPVRAKGGRPREVFAETPPPSKTVAILTYKGRPLTALPADPVLLKQVLQQGYESPVTSGSPSSYIFEGAFQLLTEPVTPAVRSTVYRVLAGLPGVQNLGTVRDVDGQAGSGIALTTRQPRCLISGTAFDSGSGSTPPTSSCVVQQRLIVNPVTGMPLAQELSYVKAPGDGQWPAPGGMFSYQTLRHVGWENSPPPGP